MISILQPYPGSPIYMRPDKFGVKILNSDYSNYLYPRANINTQKLNSDELTKLYSEGLLRIINTYGSIGDDHKG